MFERIRSPVLRLMRVPLAPTPPLGAPDSVRIFRAGDNYFKLRLLGWIVGQIGAAAALAVSLYLSWTFVGYVRAAQTVATLAPAPAAPAAPASIAPAAPTSSPVQPPAAPSKRSTRAKGDNALKNINRTAPWVIVLIELAEAGAVLFFLAQLPVTFAILRLDFEMHWYIVTDRSLRIRTGVLRLQETTMSFANLQQVTVTQGPLQRLLGLADVRVQSAGGGGSDHQQPGADPSLHTGVFHGVANATEVRDLILERLRRFRAAGLGDPDDHTATEPAADPTLSAARELLAEAVALRGALVG